MTGIERLRQFAKGCRLVGQKTFSNAIGDIADQIEHEQDAMVADSPYDALPPEDREAIAWVREHGGLDYVKREWSSRVPRDLYERRRQSLLGHIAECETALGRRNARIEELGRRVGDLTSENAELRKRAMPEGYEWPRYESGEPLRYEDRYVYNGRECEVWHVDFDSYGEPTILNKDGTRFHPDKGERVKRPAVPAADGEPLEVGQTVWDVSNGIEFTVIGLINRGERQVVKLRLSDDGSFTALNPDQLTHQRPVLDADGVPVKVGDHGWWVEQPGVEIVVKHIDPDECDQLTVCDVHGRGNTIGADEFTHTKPEPSDSWESIEEDARGLDSGVDRELFTHTHEDIVSRCRALAERERGE